MIEKACEKWLKTLTHHWIFLNVVLLLHAKILVVLILLFLLGVSPLLNLVLGIINW